MDIKAKIEEIVNKIKNDDELGKKFAKEPVKTLEELLGVDLPDEQIKAMVDSVKAKLEGAGISDKLDLNEKAAKIGDAIGGLFGKK